MISTSLPLFTLEPTSALLYFFSCFVFPPKKDFTRKKANFLASLPSSCPFLYTKTKDT